MTNKLIKLLYLSVLTLSMTIDLKIESMELQEQTSWNNLPSEIMQYILSLIPNLDGTTEILESLKSVTRVNKELRALARDLVYNWHSNNLIKKYVQQDLDGANKDFLYRAVNGRDRKLLKILAQAGVDISELYFGCSALIWAVQFGNKELMEVLINANVDVKGACGSIALKIARDINYKEIVQMLVYKRAKSKSFKDLLITPPTLKFLCGWEVARQQITVDKVPVEVIEYADKIKTVQLSSRTEEEEKLLINLVNDPNLSDEMIKKNFQELMRKYMVNNKRQLLISILITAGENNNEIVKLLTDLLNNSNTNSDATSCSNS